MEVNNLCPPVILYGDVVQQDLHHPLQELPGLGVRLLGIAILAHRPQLYNYFQIFVNYSRLSRVRGISILVKDETVEIPFLAELIKLKLMLMGFEY